MKKLRTLARFVFILNKLQHTCFIMFHFLPYIAKYYAHRADIEDRFEPCSAQIRIVDVMVNGKCS